MKKGKVVVLIIYGIRLLLFLMFFKGSINFSYLLYIEVYKGIGVFIIGLLLFYRFVINICK